MTAFAFSSELSSDKYITMNLQELDSFKLSDAVKFHDTLNPEIFSDEVMLPHVRRQLLLIAQDFLQHIGITDYQVEDITLSGSNAAYSYTPHSDIDVHVLVDIDSLGRDEIYRELFNCKKIEFNDTHDIKIGGYDVELYVQNSREPVRSLGEYSILNNRWLKLPTKRRSNFDETAAKQKFKKLVQLISTARREKNIDKVEGVLRTIKKYRQAGLDKHGEWGPENLAYKAARTQGLLQDLWDYRNQLHSEELSLSENEDDDLRLGASDWTARRAQSSKVSQTPLIWKKPQHIGGSWRDSELRNRGFKLSKYGSWGGTQSQWDSLRESSTPINEISGYIPSQAERNDPRWKTALTVDVTPNSIKDNVKKLGLGKINRSGRPPQASPSGKF